MRRITVVSVVVLFAALAGAYVFRGRLSQYLKDDVPPAPTPVEWVETGATEAPEPTVTSPEPVRENAPPAIASLPFAVDLSRPLRVAWPMDVGPDVGPDAPDARLCLRSRQGANEFLTSDDASALYAFRLAGPAKVRLWLRARYTQDGVGKVECNNSCVGSLDGAPARVVGNDSTRAGWAWRRWAAVELDAGVHWLRIASREDGVVLDRMVVAADAPAKSTELDQVPLVSQNGFEGETPPKTPQHPVQPVEVYALPTASLVVGAGHTNEITICASWQGGERFEGRIAIESATAQGVTAKGTQTLVCGPGQPFARQVVEIIFPPETPRREHAVTVRVADKAGRIIFRDEIRFLKAFAWAFLGPFPEKTRASATAAPAFACDRSPALLAGRADLERLGLAALGKPEWKIVDDGSCYDWTGSVDLLRVFGPTRDAFAYAVTWVDSSMSMGRRVFSMQADDAAWLWVNGRFLVDLPVDLPREANRLWTSAALRRGPNPVVIKIHQVKYYWGYRVDVLHWYWHGRRGDTITGIDPAQWPKHGGGAR